MLLMCPCLWRSQCHLWNVNGVRKEGGGNQIRCLEAILRVNVSLKSLQPASSDFFFNGNLCSGCIADLMLLEEFIHHNHCGAKQFSRAKGRLRCANLMMCQFESSSTLFSLILFDGKSPYSCSKCCCHQSYIRWRLPSGQDWERSTGGTNVVPMGRK